MKRTFDLLGSLVLLVLLSPVFLFVAIAIVVESGRTVFFRQERVGRGGEAFLVWKFRTMVL